MSLLRRSAQVVALVGTLIIGVIAVALIVSQTPWFKDWLRRYVIRQSGQYLNGELSIGGLGGNLFFGVDLSNVALDVSGERVIAVKDLQVDYSVFDFISRGLVIDDIRITEPRIVLRRDADGRWNLASLVREQQQEAEREGPGRAVAIGGIGISNGHLTIDDRTNGRPVGTSGTSEAGAFRIPEQIHRLDARMSFHYEPVRFTVVMDHVSFRTESPSLDVNRIQGTVAVREDDLFLETIKIHTAESSLDVHGAIEQYATTPVLKLDAASQGLSFKEMARVVPALENVRLRPAFSVKANGPLGALGLQVNAASEAGRIDADVTADVEAPRRGVRGRVSTSALNLAPLVGDPAQKSDITGTARVDLQIPEGGMDGARGTFAFRGPRVAIAGYEATKVDASGSVNGPRYTIDGRANAYGGAATARGHIVMPNEARGRALQFSLNGRAAGVNLRSLPASVNAPRLSTNINTDYHVEGSGRRIAAEARLDRSTVEGATLEPGTVASFASDGPGRLEYAATGVIRELDAQRLGRGLRIAALSAERYASRINARFDMRGSGTELGTLRLDATGAIENSHLFGGEVPALDFEAHIQDGGLHARASGELAGFDPAALSGRADLKGTVGGRVNVDARLPDMTAIDPGRIDASAQVQLNQSTIGPLDLEGGTIDATVRDGMARVKDLSLEGTDLNAHASGDVALSETGTSNLKFQLQAASLKEIGRIVNQPLDGGATVEGSITGSRANLKIAGTLDGSNLTYSGNGALDVNSTFNVALPELNAADAIVEADTRATFVKIGGIEIQEIRAKTTYGGKKVGFDAIVADQGRQLEARGDAILHPDHSEVHLPSFALRSQGIEWRMAGSDAAVQYRSEGVSFQNVRLQSGNQFLEVDGAVTTKAEAETGDLTVKAANVDLAQLQKLLLTDRGVTGRFSADARLVGALSAPQVDGNISIVNGTFRDFRFDSLNSKVSYSSTAVTVDARLQQNPTQWLTVKGVAPMTLFRAEPAARAGHVAPAGADRVDLQIASSVIDLGVIQGFTTQVTGVRGTIQAQVRVTGSGRDPHVDGSVAIRNGAFSLPIGGTSFTGLDTTLQLTNDKIVIPGFQILDENGHPLLIAGELAVHSGSVGAVNIGLQSDSFELIDNELGDVGIDSVLKITGELRRPAIQGEIRVEDGRLQIDEILAMVSSPYPTDLPPEPIEPGAAASADERGATTAATRALGDPRRNVESEKIAETQTKAAGQAEPSGTLMDNLTLDVRVRIPDNLVLRGTDLRPGGPGGLALGDVNVTVGGDVRVRKQPNDTIRLVGTINTVRGFYEFQGRRFDVERDGRVRFAGLTELNPQLDVRATRVIDGVEARVNIRGTALAPELVLSSNPPLDEADILSLIVFNRSINDLNEGERISLAQRAGAVAGGFVAAPLAASIGRALDVDLFEIQATDESGLLGPGITLGQQIGEHLFVKFHQQFGQQDTSEFIIEYQIAEFMRLRASGSPSDPAKVERVALRRVERAGADLVFFFSY